MTDPVHIIGLRASNVRTLRAVDLELSGAAGLIPVRGPNGAGKSTLLDLIPMALAGAGAVDRVPIRQGESRGELEVVTSTGLRIKRTFTPNGTYLHVTDASGMKGNQSLLDRLLGRGASIDPHAFMRLRDREQVEQLAGSLGLDLTAHDEAVNNAFERRADLNRELKAADLRARNLLSEVAEDAPESEVSLDDITAELSHAHAMLRENDRLREAVGSREGALQRAEETETRKLAERTEDLAKRERYLEECRVALADAERDLDTARETWGKVLVEEAGCTATARAALTEARETAAALVDPDLDSIAERLAHAEEGNGKARVRALAEEAARHAGTLGARQMEVNVELETARQARARAIAEADLPVPGLGIGDGYVTYQGLPLSQAATSQQLRVSMAIEMARAPDLRVICFSDASLLDETSLAVVRELAGDRGYQVFAEMVSDDPGSEGIYVEDGAVVAVDGVPVGAPDSHEEAPDGSAPERAGEGRAAREREASAADDAFRDMGDERHPDDAPW